MENVGAEVGQKMRSAVKAKLMELGCYVDDELPDYIMVMVANKRTKSQMNHDLELFLNAKTTPFVEWLYVVLKKLEEITITNPQVLKKVSKRKSTTTIKSVKVKKEKKDKISRKSKKKEASMSVLKIKDETEGTKSLTDDLPVKPKKVSEVRKIVIMKENNGSSNNNSTEENVVDDNFDIPPLSEVSNESELADIEKKIKSVKSRLGIQVASGSEDEDYINLKADPDDLFSSDVTSMQKKLKEEILRKISLLDASEENIDVPSTVSHISDHFNNQKNEHPRIIFGHENLGSPSKKVSVMERLGKRQDTSKLNNSDIDPKRKKVNLLEARREEEQILGVSKLSKSEDSSTNNHYGRIGEKGIKRATSGETPRESALKRLGVMSKIAIPLKDSHSSNADNDEEELPDLVSKEVPSAVKVKPRALPPPTKQANKNLLLKAVAEAQRSIAQTPIVGNNKLDPIYTKRYRENLNIKSPTKKLSMKDKNNLRSIIANAAKQDKKEVGLISDDDNLEYIPKPIKRTSKSNTLPAYVPSSRDHSSDDCENNMEVENSDISINSNSLPKQTKNQTFIITLDGISRNHDIKGLESRRNIEECENSKRKPSPIIFSTNTSPVISKRKAIPDNLSADPSPSSIKTKERCKFWPSCRQGEKCEFLHPNTSCRSFPQCKFGDRCLYIHPTCKFELSCTRKECPYSHSTKASFNNVSAKTPQLCKFYPNCSNIHCSFYHPKPCKYGNNCKNPLQCTFTHTFPTKNNLTWRIKS